MIKFDNTANHSIQLYSELKKNREKLCDVQLKVQDTLIPAHKIILVFNSGYFQSKFAGTISYSDSHDAVVAIEEEFSLDSIKSIVDYMYDGILNFTPENAMNLLTASSFYQIEFIKEKCCEFLTKSITNENCIRTWCLLDLMNCNTDEIHKFIATSIVHIIRHLDFLSLNDKELILRFFTNIRKFICNISAEGFFLAMIAWIKHDEEARKPFSTELIKIFPLQFLNTILQHIRHEKLIQENSELASWLLNGKIDTELCKHNSNSILIMEKDATFYWFFNPDTMNLKRIKSTMELTGFSLVTVDSKILLIGGKLKNGEYSKYCYILDTVVREWNRIKFEYEIENYKSCQLNGKIYLLGTKNEIVEMISFDIETQAIGKLSAPPFYKFCNIFASDGSIYLVSLTVVMDSNLEGRIHILDIMENSWKNLPTTLIERFQSYDMTLLLANLMESNSVKKLSNSVGINVKTHYDILYCYIEANRIYGICRFKQFFKMVENNPTFYQVSNQGFSQWVVNEWEEIMIYNFEGAHITSLP